MKERIRLIRKGAKMTQEEFGKVIGLSTSGVKAIEYGASNVSENTRNRICNEFKIARTWLETGEGPMKLESTADEELIDEWLADCPEWQKAALIALIKTPNGWETFAEFCRNFKELMDMNNGPVE